MTTPQRTNVSDYLDASCSNVEGLTNRVDERMTPTARIVSSFAVLRHGRCFPQKPSATHCSTLSILERRCFKFSILQTQ